MQRNAVILGWLFLGSLALIWGVPPGYRLLVSGLTSYLSAYVYAQVTKR